MDPQKGEMDKKKLARFVGVVNNVEPLMTFWCLLPSFHVIARSSVTPVTAGELAQTGIQQQLKDLDTVIHDKIGDKPSEKHVPFAGLLLLLTDIFEDNINLDDNSGKL